MNDQEIRLELFPDTGHQFFTIDLEDLLVRRPPSGPGGAAPPAITYERLSRFVDAQMGHGSHGANGNGNGGRQVAGWQPWADTTPWILHRYDYLTDPDRDQPRPVLQLAIESNLGDFDRGTIVSLQSRTNGGPAAEHPLHEVLRRAGTPLPDALPMEEPLLPYVARPHELAAQWIEGEMWLEDAFGGGRRRLPTRRGEGAANLQRDLELFLPPETVKIVWFKSQRDKPVDVDLIVDLGNTRTVALLLEDPGVNAEQTSFGARVEPVRFLPRGWAYDHPALDSGLEPFGLIDSWVLLQRPPFANLEPPFSAHKLRSYCVEPEMKREKTAHLIDQRFVALAPVLVGGGREATGAARTLAQATMARGAKESLFFLSSPKRYAWDNTSIGLRRQFWWQMANPHDGDLRRLVKFDGLLRFYMNPSAEQYDLKGATPQDLPFTSQTDFLGEARYPLSDATCWFALAVLETARRQINSRAFLLRSKLPHTETIRRLRRVRVTYPAGWPCEEREAYLGQWRRALRLFAIAHLADPRPRDEGGDAPTLAEDPIDEAVASQLPLLVAEVRAFGQDPGEWLQLYGEGGEVRVMNVDIGGGTTDVAIVRYSQPAAPGGRTQHAWDTAELRADLLHREGTAVAGDRLVKRIIEQALLPAWLGANAVLFTGNRAAAELLHDLFSAPREEPIVGRDPDASAKLSRLVRLAFVPLANAILARLRAADRAGAAHLAPLPIAEVVDRKVVDELNVLVLELAVQRCEHWADLGPPQLKALRYGPAFTEWFSRTLREAPKRLPFLPTATLTFPVAELQQAVDDVFAPMLERLALKAEEFGCHIVIVSGKPSELGRVRTLIERALPLPAQRILHVQGYRVGSWYPPCLVEAGGRIRDAKTVTVTGAALYEDIKNRNTRGLRLVLPPEGTHAAARYHYGQLGERGQRLSNVDPIFRRDTPAGEMQPVAIRLFTVIGRWTDEGLPPEPVYRIEYRLLENEAEPAGMRQRPVCCKLRLSIDRGFGERLEIVPGTVSFPEVDGLPLDPARVQLRLHTMVETAFWMEEPAFELNLAHLAETA